MPKTDCEMRVVARHDDKDGAVLLCYHTGSHSYQTFEVRRGGNGLKFLEKVKKGSMLLTTLKLIR